jgi:hypothetical protein
MYGMRRRQNLPEGLDGNVVLLRPYQHKAARQRRLAWWTTLIFGRVPADARQAKAMPSDSSGAVLRFRGQAGAARW